MKKLVFAAATVALLLSTFDVSYAKKRHHKARKHHTTSSMSNTNTGTNSSSSNKTGNKSY
jgi:hypothetical protein